MRVVLVAALASSKPELDFAKAVVEAEGHEDDARRDLSKLERDRAQVDREIEAAKDKVTAATTNAERESATAALMRLANDRTTVDRSIATQQAAVREAEVAARKVRIQSKQ